MYPATHNIAVWDRALRVMFGLGMLAFAPGWWKVFGGTALLSAAWNH